MKRQCGHAVIAVRMRCSLDACLLNRTLLPSIELQPLTLADQPRLLARVHDGIGHRYSS